MAELAVQNSMDALVKGDDALAERIIADDRKIDAIEAQARDLITRLEQAAWDTAEIDSLHDDPGVRGRRYA